MVRVSSPPLEVCKDFRYKSTIQALDLGLVVMAISSSLKAQSQWLYAGVWAGIRQRQGRHKTVRDVPKLGKPTAVLWAALPGCPQTKPAFPLVALPFVPLPPPACPPPTLCSGSDLYSLQAKTTDGSTRAMPSCPAWKGLLHAPLLG